eukprot:scaffold40729_cov33-Phaeocystis_antarctica.AAC.2
METWATQVRQSSDAEFPVLMQPSASMSHTFSIETSFLLSSLAAPPTECGESGSGCPDLSSPIPHLHVASGQHTLGSQSPTAQLEAHQ